MPAQTPETPTHRKRVVPEQPSSAEARRERKLPNLREETRVVDDSISKPGLVFENAQLADPPHDWVKIKKFTSTDLDDRRRARIEIELAERFSDKGAFARVIGYSFADEDLQLVMQNYSENTLRDYLYEMNGRLNRDQVQALVKRIGNAILILHSTEKPVFHGDIKPSNILLDHDVKNGPISTAVLADFGASSEIADAGHGTPVYMPPSALREDSMISYRNDMFAFMVTLYELISGGLLPLGEVQAELRVAFAQGAIDSFRVQLAMLKYVHEEKSYTPLAMVKNVDSSLRPYMGAIDRVFAKVALEDTNNEYKSFAEFYQDLQAALVYEEADSELQNSSGDSDQPSSFPADETRRTKS